jgi:hypothetical protein
MSLRHIIHNLVASRADVFGRPFSSLSLKLIAKNLHHCSILFLNNNGQSCHVCLNQNPLQKKLSSRCSKEWTRNIALIDSKPKEYEKGCGLPLQQCKLNGPKIEQYDHCSFRTAVRAHGGHG